MDALYGVLSVALGITISFGRYLISPHHLPLSKWASSVQWVPPFCQFDIITTPWSLIQIKDHRSASQHHFFSPSCRSFYISVFSNKKPSFSILQKGFFRNTCTILIYMKELSCYVAKLLFINYYYYPFQQKVLNPQSQISAVLYDESSRWWGLRYGMVPDFRWEVWSILWYEQTWCQF